MSLPPFDWAEHESALDDPAQHIPFDPVPRRRARRRGWSEARQRAFIFALSRCGSVACAAGAVGMARRSAYQLLDAEGADSFAAAWDQAIDEGLERVRSEAFQRALGGVFVPVFRRGTFDPKTNTVTLEGEGQGPDGRGGSYRIEGVVTGDVVRGAGATWRLLGH